MTAIVIGLTVLGVALMAWDAWRRTLASRVEARDQAKTDAIAKLAEDHEATRRRVQRLEDGGGRR